MERINAFEKLWGIDPNNPHILTQADQLLDLVADNIFCRCENVGVIQKSFDEHITEVVETVNKFKIENEILMEDTVRINRLLEFVYYLKNMCIAKARIFEISNLTHDYSDNIDACLFRFRAIDTEGNNHFQNFLLYVLEYFYKNKYARYQDYVYEWKKCFL